MAFRVVNKLGVWGENIAEIIYTKRGYYIVARNVYNPRGRRFGELDLIARKGKLLVFVEVKTRHSKRFGNPAESVTYSKQQKLLKTVQWFLLANPQFIKFQPRIDVCLIEQAQLDKSVKSVIIIPNAVELNC